MNELKEITDKYIAIYKQIVKEELPKLKAEKKQLEKEKKKTTIEYTNLRLDIRGANERLNIIREMITDLKPFGS